MHNYKLRMSNPHLHNYRLYMNVPHLHNYRLYEALFRVAFFSLLPTIPAHLHKKRPPYLLLTTTHLHMKSSSAMTLKIKFKPMFSGFNWITTGEKVFEKLHTLAMLSMLSIT